MVKVEVQLIQLLSSCAGL